MSPSLLQLHARGIQDSYLTQEPQINVFKYNYYRYVNFATDSVEINLNNAAVFGQKSTCVLPMKGHLLSKLYLHLKLPALVPTSGTYACWSDTLGYAIFRDAIELQVGGITVDRLYPHFLYAWDELSNATKRNGRDLMLLKSDVYVSSKTNAEKEIDLVIPLEFWFTKQYNMALPILSMANQEIRINFNLRKFSECINYDGPTPPEPVDIISSSIFGEYIFLDESIYKQLRDQKHTFLIDQVQYNGAEIIQPNATSYSTLLKFNNPCKEILFFCVETENINNNNYFNFSKNGADALVSRASLYLNGRPRFDNLPEFYYRLIFPDCVHVRVPTTHIYCMPFCLRPEDNQPTGSINMTKFDDVTLGLTLAPNNGECQLFTYAINYNLVTIEKGFLKLEFVY